MMLILDPSDRMSHSGRPANRNLESERIQAQHSQLAFSQCSPAQQLWLYTPAVLFHPGVVRIRL